MKVTIKDIANAANVSLATVSNAISGNNRIGEETRLRILELANRMGYRNPNLQALKKGVRLIMFRKYGRVVTDTPFFSELLAGIECACRKNGYELSISWITEKDQSVVDWLSREQNFLVLLLATEMNADELKPFLKIKVPMVILDNNFYSNGIPSVYIDNVRAGYIACKYLIERGHRDIGFIASTYSFNNMRQRLMGLKVALEDAGLSIRPENIFRVDPTLDGAYHDMKTLLEAHNKPLPTAIFAFNDIAAMGSLRAMNNCGISVPKDVSLIGMDNFPTTKIITPSLTTVNVHKYAMGYQAVEKLIHLNDDTYNHQMHTVIGVHLVERESVRDIESE